MIGVYIYCIYYIHIVHTTCPLSCRVLPNLMRIRALCGGPIVGSASSLYFVEARVSNPMLIVCTSVALSTYVCGPVRSFSLTVFGRCYRRSRVPGLSCQHELSARLHAGIFETKRTCAKHADMPTPARAHTHTRTNARTHTHTHARTHARTHTHTHTHTHTCTPTHIDTRTTTHAHDPARTGVGLRVSDRVNTPGPSATHIWSRRNQATVSVGFAKLCPLPFRLVQGLRVH